MTDVCIAWTWSLLEISYLVSKLRWIGPSAIELYWVLLRVTVDWAGFCRASHGSRIGISSLLCHVSRLYWIWAGFYCARLGFIMARKLTVLGRPRLGLVSYQQAFSLRLIWFASIEIQTVIDLWCRSACCSRKICSTTVRTRTVKSWSATLASRKWRTRASWRLPAVLPATSVSRPRRFHFVFLSLCTDR